MNKKKYSSKTGPKELSSNKKNPDDKIKKIVKFEENKVDEVVNRRNSNSKEKNISKEKQINTAKINNVPITTPYLALPPIKTANLQTSAGNIKVLCRFRPLNEKEKNISQDLCVDFNDNQTCSIKSSGENNVYKFNFDRIFDINCTQQQVYEDSAMPIIDSVLEGFNGTVFAFGQTSSGKTHTMQGVLDNPELEGIIPRMIHQVFNHILNSVSDIEYTVKVSMIEIYMEKIKDLIDISRVNLNVREEKLKGLYIEELSEHYVISEEEVIELMKIGSDNRSVAATNMNENSSRSHSIVIMTVHQNNLKDLSAKTGKLYLVDLAGSEKISKSGATGLTLEEAKTINKSLTTLGMVINSLTDGKSTHVPYRESKLTRVLQESLGGNAKTALIITCSPSVYNESETLSTLRFGLRAKKIKNKPKINKEVTVAELKLEIEKLEKLLNKYLKRISQLENFIRKNGLQVPNEEDDDEDVELVINENKENIDDNEILNGDQNDNKGINEHPSQLNKEIVSKQIKINELTEKNENIEEKLKILEEEKIMISKRLHEAIDKISEYNSSKEERLKVNDEIEQIKNNFDDTINIQKEKIQQLEQLIGIQNVSFKAKKSSINYDSPLKIEENIKSLDFYNKLVILSETHDDLKNLINEFKPSSKEKQLILDHPVDQENIKNSSFIVNNYNFEIKNIIGAGESEVNNAQKIDEKQEKIEEFKKEKKKFENEKKYILKTLEEKAEKIAQLEIENKEFREKYKLIESKLNPEDKNYVKKIMSLEKNLEQINLMYHQLVTQKSELKILNIVLEKKIKKRQERLNQLEKDVIQLNDQIKSLNEKINIMQRGTMKNYAPNNVVKVMKGGHIKSAAMYSMTFNNSENFNNQNANAEFALKRDLSPDNI